MRLTARHYILPKSRRDRCSYQSYRSEPLFGPKLSYLVCSLGSYSEKFFKNLIFEARQIEASCLSFTEHWLTENRHVGRHNLLPPILLRTYLPGSILSLLNQILGLESCLVRSNMQTNPSPRLETHLSTRNANSQLQTPVPHLPRMPRPLRHLSHQPRRPRRHPAQRAPQHQVRRKLTHRRRRPAVCGLELLNAECAR